MARSKKNIFSAGKPAVNMSPMIDLVFLLLTFFIVASRMITVQSIPGVEIPNASESKVPDDAQGRVIINIRRDGKVLDVTGALELSMFDVQQIMTEARLQNPKVKLHIRADKNVEHKKVSDVINASRKGGVGEVIFSNYVQ